MEAALEGRKDVARLKGYWKQLENKREMKDSTFMKWNNCIN
jgi:hypothetical protein